MKVITFAGSAPVVGVVAVGIVIWLVRRQRRREAVFTFVAIAGAGTLNVLLKGLFGRTRPEVFPHLVVESSSSFPSGHTMSAVALAATVIVLCWPTLRRWPVAIGATGYALAVGVSRLYLGVHYPSDVIAGWAVTIAWVTVAWLVVLHRPAHESGDARGAGAPSDDGSDPAPTDDATLPAEAP
jgi:membrane-associated phospholipid phosphatase